MFYRTVGRASSAHHNRHFIFGPAEELKPAAGGGKKTREGGEKGTRARIFSSQIPAQRQNSNFTRNN